MSDPGFLIIGASSAPSCPRNNLITFISVAAALFFFILAPVNHLMARRVKEDPDTKECPECTTAIPIKARRGPQCTAELVAAT
jgi:large conductance mechanosensitive channel